MHGSTVVSGTTKTGSEIFRYFPPGGVPNNCEKQLFQNTLNIVYEYTSVVISV